MATVPALVVPARCCGPDTSGNGGWVCGAVAAHLPDRPAEVSLRLPPPLDVPLAVEVAEEDGVPVVTVRHDGAVVATGRPGRFEHEPPAFVPLDRATAAAERYIGLVDHAFPHCMSCGPERAAGDGLRIFPGALDPDDLTRMAAPWHAADLAGDVVDGVLPEEVVWTALDCPSGWPSIASADRPMVLGRMTAQVLAPVPPTDLVVVGTELWSDGRKHAGASALYTPDGDLLGRAESLWIELH